MSNQTGKSILFIANVFDGHIPAAIEVIKDLISLGHNVTCYTLDRFENRFKKTRAKLKPISVSKIEMPNDAPPIAINSYLLERFYDLVLADVQNSKEKYDYFFFDSFFDGTQINKIFNIPVLVGVYAFPVGEMNQFIKKDAIERAKVFKGISKKYNINIGDFVTMHFSGDAKYKLILTSKLFHIESKLIDDSYFFIGPPLEERPIDETFTFKKDEGKKLIYLSLGTIFNSKINIYKLFIEAFGNSKEYQGIISIGNNNNAKDLGEIPENIKVYNYVPQLQVLKQCDIFITHGGINSINEALYLNNLPLIVIPQEIDQFDNAKQIEKLEAGIALDKDNLSSEILKSSVKKITENVDKYKAGVEKIVKSFKEAREGKLKIYEKIFG